MWHHSSLIINEFRHLVDSLKFKRNEYLLLPRWDLDGVGKRYLENPNRLVGHQELQFCCFSCCYFLCFFFTLCFIYLLHVHIVYLHMVLFYLLPFFKCYFFLCSLITACPFYLVHIKWYSFLLCSFAWWSLYLQQLHDVFSHFFQFAL